MLNGRFPALMIYYVLYDEFKTLIIDKVRLCMLGRK